MGYPSAVEMRQYLSEEQALVWHLSHNHYPPISLAFLPVIQKALAAALRREFHVELVLPNGRVVSVSTVIEEVHLEAFLEDSDEYLCVV